MKPLTDSFDRKHEYLRLSVTDRCNLRCRYCVPTTLLGGTPKENLLSFEEIVRLAQLFVRIGIRKIRVTGGEPLARRGIVELCASLASLPGLEVLGLSTNGTMLAPMLAPLLKAGVQQLNISLDSLDPRRFEAITGRPGLERVLESLDRALQIDFLSVKINCVVMRGVNSDELPAFVELAAQRGLNIRFIEFMPFRSNGWSPDRFISAREMRNLIESQWRLIPRLRQSLLQGPADEFVIEGSHGIIGFIATLSKHFCASCNRLRLSADGQLRNCLFCEEELDLKSLLRECATDKEIEASIRAELDRKWRFHPEAREILAANTRPMVHIGG